jgi:ribulose-phosphate 3-epimerase
MTADFTRLGDQVKEAIAARVDRIHLDIMDGHFVPNISFGPLVAKALRPICPLPLEAHLMINNADQYLEAFFEAGVDSVILHIEACSQIENTIKTVRRVGKKVGVTLNPATPLSTIERLIPSVDLVLIMSVQPGFGGQSFLPGSVEKIKQAKLLIEKLNPRCELEVDGGIHLQTLGEASQAGAEVFVVGSSVYNSHASVAENVRQLMESVHAR